MEKYQNYLDNFEKQRREIKRLWNISRETADFLSLLIKLQKPHNILEIGTSNGYSTFILAVAAEEFGGRIETIECDSERYELAKQNLKGIDNITLHYGKAEDIIPELNEKYDFVFLDANKEQYHQYLRLLIPKLKSPSLLIADNVESHKHSVREYLNEVRKLEDSKSINIPIGSGLELTLYGASI